MTTAPTTGADFFDVTPDPRILPMLGEISLTQWRCIAELIDNSVDAFIEAKRAGQPVHGPEVVITVPTNNSAGNQISIRDNGNGMDGDTLQRAVRAGWTSHDPINNLGLFGMGFNIATARLGTRTIVWSARKGDSEWVGTKIDFEELARLKAFRTPRLTRPKLDLDQSGTEIIIENIKPEQREWFAKAQNRSQVNKHLGRTYSAMLGRNGVPISFNLQVNGNQVRPRRHCVWGGPGDTVRSVETAKYGTIDAFQQINAILNKRPFCTQCWNWLGADQTECSQCEADGLVVLRDRQIRGWLGIQRFLDNEDFGIDFLRNGRKIEHGNKELFNWVDSLTEREEREYPIDDPRYRGRIVGEIHLDHCRVTYTKDRFVREDVAWGEMVQAVRGQGPLRPDLARSLGLGENASPLFKLFQAFRRSTPHNKGAGGWAKLLMVKDNDRAVEMAKRFEAGEADYQTDTKWWDLAQEADTEVLTGMPGSGSTGGAVLGEDDDQEGGLGDTLGEPNADGTLSNGTTTVAPVIAPVRVPVPSLTDVFQGDSQHPRFEVQAFAVQPNDPALNHTRAPWAIRKTTSGHWEFFVVPTHRIFRSATMTPLDALITQLAWQARDLTHDHGEETPFVEFLFALREKYNVKSKLDPAALSAESLAQLADAATSVVGRIPADVLRSFFEDCGPSLQDRIRLAMAQRGASNPQGAISDGRYLQYAPARTIADFILVNPEHFFDGTYWIDEYSTLDFGSGVATEEARKRVLSYYASLLADTVWLAEQGVEELGNCSRERLLRASLATALIAPTAQSVTQ